MYIYTRMYFGSAGRDEFDQFICIDKHMRYVLGHTWVYIISVLKFKMK
jgi:hypothetical protein